MRKLAVLSVLSILFVNAPLCAGAFEMRTIAYWVDRFGPDYLVPGLVLVEVTARSVYVGAPDFNDKNYIIQTTLNWQSGGDLYDWAYPDAIGNGRNGQGVPFTGMPFDCGFACAAAGNVPTCYGKWDNRYLGHGAVAILHAFNPEIDALNGPITNTYCELQPVKECPDEGGLPGCSPILLDLDNNGFHLTGFDDGVRFDFDGVGETGRYGWTKAGTQDGFLALDRNADGRIDNGLELFGNLTLMADGSRADSGYEALAELDAPENGGNEDGSLTTDDQLFGELLLWIDENHSGFSEPGELLTLAEAGVLELSYRYHESRRQDGYGNQFRYQASALVENASGQPRRAVTYDVFFVSPAE